MSYVLKVRIQWIECLPAQSTEQLHIQLQPTRISNDLRHSVAAHATNRKKPFNVGLRGWGRNEIQCIVGQTAVRGSVLLFSWDCVVSQSVYAVLVADSSLAARHLKRFSAGTKNLACAIHYSISFVNYFYLVSVSFCSNRFYIYIVSVFEIFSVSVSV